MAKRITAAQLSRAIRTAPKQVIEETNNFLVRGLSEYKRVAIQSSPWRIGQQGGGVPRDTGNLRENHQTKIETFSGTFGVNEQRVPYAPYVHEGTRRISARPWLDYARQRSDKAIEKHYKVFMDNILKHIAG